MEFLLIFTLLFRCGKQMNIFGGIENKALIISFINRIYELL